MSEACERGITKEFNRLKGSVRWECVTRSQAASMSTHQSRPRTFSSSEEETGNYAYVDTSESSSTAATTAMGTSLATISETASRPSPKFKRRAPPPPTSPPAGAPPGSHAMSGCDFQLRLRHLRPVAGVIFGILVAIFLVHIASVGLSFALADDGGNSPYPPPLDGDALPEATPQARSVPPANITLAVAPRRKREEEEARIATIVARLVRPLVESLRLIAERAVLTVQNAAAVYADVGLDDVMAAAATAATRPSADNATAPRSTTAVPA